MKILVSARQFPVTMSRYWEGGFEALGHTVIRVGPIDPRGPDIVPWSPPAMLPQYAKMPDVLTPNVDVWHLDQVLSMVEKPDLIVQAGDVFWLDGDAPEGIPNVIVATDPHAVDVHPRLVHADLFVSMQKFYLDRDFKGYTGKKTWIPYGYEPTIHRKLENEPDLFDVCFIGLPYPQRTATLEQMQQRDIKVLNRLGIVYHESNKLYNQSKIAFNWASQQDTPARVFEGMAAGCMMLTNRLPDLPHLGFVENVHYVGFDTAEEAVEKVLYYLGRPEEMKNIADAGHAFVEPMSWKNRAAQLLERVGL